MTTVTILPVGKRYAGVYIERSVIRVALERVVRHDPVLGDPITVCECPVREFPISAKERTNNARGHELLREVAEFIADCADDLTAIGIGSYGPFVSLGPPSQKSFGSSSYGELHQKSDLPFRGANLPQIFKSAFERYGGQPTVAVTTDANVCALGQAWISKSDIDSDTVIVSILITDGVGGGFVAGRQLLGALHPEVGLIQIALYPKDPLFESRGPALKETIYARNPGDLSNIPSIFERARNEKHAPRTINALLNIQTPAVWLAPANYIAQICLTFTVLFTPTQIVLHGPLVPNESSRFLRAVRSEFEELRLAREQQNYMMDYHHIRQPTPPFIRSPSTLNRDVPITSLSAELAGCIYLAFMADKGLSGYGRSGEVIPYPARSGE